MNRFKLLVIGLTMLVSTMTRATETINFFVGVSPAHSGAAFLTKQLEVANGLQDKYNFILHFKPGGGGVIAIKALNTSPTNSIVSVGPHFVKHVMDHKINEDDYSSLPASGVEMCTGIVSNVGSTDGGLDSLSNYKGKELLVGATSLGSPAHMIATAIAEKYGFTIKFIPFNSDPEAAVAVASGTGVNLALASGRRYKTLLKDNNIQYLATYCAKPDRDMPNAKLLSSYGFDNIPPIFMPTLARKEMPIEKQTEISYYIELAADKMDKFTKMPWYMRPTIDNWYVVRVSQQKKFLTDYGQVKQSIVASN